jgi:beta-phosphoglucomutase
MLITRRVHNMKLKAYITDLDGTLCDTKAANTVSYEQAFHDAGLSFSRSLYEESFGLRFDEMLKILAPDVTDEQSSYVKKQKQKHYTENLDLVELNEGLLRILKDAKESGCKVGLATTAQSANALAVLDYFSLHNFFDETIFGEDVHRGKPDPECYNAIIKKLSVQPGECIIFEDTEFGMDAAKASGAIALKVII